MDIFSALLCLLDVSMMHGGLVHVAVWKVLVAPYFDCCLHP